MGNEIFQENLRMLHNFDKSLQAVVEGVEPQKWVLSSDPSGSENLLGKEKNQFLHSPEGPLKEAERWASTLKLKEINTLFVYGIGLGYYYEPLKGWLTDSRDNYLVFLEDDAEVLYHFLQTARAKEILRNPKVRIIFLEGVKGDSRRLDAMATHFSTNPYQTTALMYYLKNRVDQLLDLNTKLEYLLNLKKFIHEEYESMGAPFYRNFYVNLLKLPNSLIGSRLFKRFQGIPAIICGAGPSLEKNIDVVKRLKDKALIIAGGTSVNALNAAGINPHFGFGVDPNPDHSLRILTNEAFMVPYFYHMRMNSTALNMLHGDLYYQNVTKTYPVSYWIEKKLGIKAFPIEGGYNVVNASLDMAEALGCSPIITVGVDLAYSEGKSYAAIQSVHPVAEGVMNFVTKNEREELIPRVDIHGKPVLTLWKWMLEAVWYSKFLVSHPQSVVINATEGGIGFPGVPNMTLKEVEEAYLMKEHDFSGMIQALSLDAGMPEGVTTESILKHLVEVEQSLKRTSALVANLEKEFHQLSEEAEAGGEMKLFNPKIIESLAALEKEEAYTTFLSKFDEHYVKMIEKEMQSLEIHQESLESKEVFKRKTSLQAARYDLLGKAASINLNYLKGTIAHIEKVVHEEKAIKSRSINEADCFPKGKEYVFTEEVYSLNDPCLGIEFSGKGSSSLVKSMEGLPLGGWTWEHYTKDGHLHGPSRFVDESGFVAAESWYVDGKKWGRELTFFKNGNLASAGGYKEGKPIQLHQYYYPNGTLRAKLPYKEGLLDGKIELFYPSGVLKRSIEFEEGVRNGEEALYADKGEKIIEATFKGGKPVGKASYYSASGVLQKEVIYKAPGEVDTIFAIDSKGKFVRQETKVVRDYFDSVTLQTERLTKSLSEVFHHLKQVLLELKKESEFLRENQELMKLLNEGIVQIGEELKQLIKLGQVLVDETAQDAQSGKEPIWKTPAAKKLLMAQVTILQETVQAGVAAIRLSVENVLKAFAAHQKKKLGK
ncbi:6-hydroxymethylpterin diphosphokinase MptE-like protein [Estrella lausannensis]|uniref:6-hydroxymethylpterin diphosphokinase MptE-like domain-containing protein n=1 Tax=Estrella lausannensis TaxID=483423 RepID=A0A0H5DQE8_9BACT|nr:6-hydroxymethylpterin diphosphokinase MptE-like protein [Estrella lausannensis]CRX37779.1 conserved hypothetical protein [Estrella lausannensis]